ncbi:hypothetical protein TGCAST_310300B [Toxoplasma gondii CAST]|uniref:Uncharacterized protein n=1 Tax=Toxoplasma gondii CAST TaxID=943122 RepID=A0A425I171_TOXGO|nr:hypothetical protein TGCAST_310300B [Toxoplasma gondii CAST]
MCVHIFEVWDPPCESFAALINVLPLSAKAVVVTADRRSERERRENEGWLAPPEAPPLVLPNWQTMHPVDMEAWEKKQRRVVRTRHVKAKVIRQADGRKLAATMALHGRQAIHRDAAVSSLVSVAAMCASNSQRALRGELLPETLNLLAAELLGRSADALSPHLLSLSFLLSQSSVSLTERLFLHLEAVLRGWLEENGFVEKKQAENVDGESKELCTETAGEKRRKASEEQLRNLPPGLNVFGLVQSSPSSSDALLASGERSETSKSADTESALWESRVLAALLSSFLRVDDYRPSLDFVRLLSDALRNSLRRTAVLSSASESSAPLAIHKKDVLSLKETGALLSSFATSGYAVPPSLMACLVEHFLYDVDLFLTSSPLSPFASSPSSSSSSAEEAEQLSQSFFCSSRGRATPGDCATLLHSLASPSPLSSERLAAADKAGEQKPANLEKLRFEAMTQAWCLVAPVLHLLQPPCKLLILNSLQTAHAPPDVSSTAFFQRSLETFLRDNPDVDSSLLGSLFGTQGRE